MTLVLSTLAAYRLTRLLNRDEITKPLQRRVPTRFASGWFCYWCLGFWVSAGVTWTRRRKIDRRWAVETLATSTGVGALSQVLGLIECLAEGRGCD